MKKANYFFVMMLACLSIIACSKDDNGDNGNEDNGSSSFAPVLLPEGTLLDLKVSGEKYGWYNKFKVYSATTGVISGCKEGTYAYEVIDENVASFQCNGYQNINGPVRFRQFYYIGTLTFTSKTEAAFSGVYKYYADGVLTTTDNISGPVIITYP